MCQNTSMSYSIVQIKLANILYLIYQQVMHCINHRVGILYRENLAKKSYELRFFFIDNDANLFYVTNLPKIQKVIRLSKDMKQVKSKLIKLGQKSLDLKKYTISAPKAYSTQAVIPFGNRICLQIKQKQAKNDDKIFQVFGFVEEDTYLIFQQINHLTGKQKKSPRKRKSIIEQQKQKQEQDTQKVFQNFIRNKQKFYMQNEDNDVSQYQGEKIGKIPQGRGKQIIIQQGITYTGQFKGGKKYGMGYLVNQNLDTFECDFINDELAGI